MHVHIFLWIENTLIINMKFDNHYNTFYVMYIRNTVNTTQKFSD